MISCQDDEGQLPRVIDEELRPYIEDFIKEAELRGIILNVEDIHAELVEELTLTEDQSYCGFARWDYPVANKGRFEIKLTEAST